MPKKYSVKYYNLTNTCNKNGCKNRLIPGKAYREYNKEGNWTGKWLCYNCWQEYYRRVNISSYLADYKIGNLDKNCSVGKGYIFQKITCIARNVKDLNIENMNFSVPIDHTRDTELGIIQTKGAIYSYGMWCYNIKNEIKKNFDNIIFYCMDRDMKNVCRVYIVPRLELHDKTTICIYEDWSKAKVVSVFEWIEKYRVDEKPYNDAYHKILEDIEKGNDPIVKKDKLRIRKEKVI